MRRIRIIDPLIREGICYMKNNGPSLPDGWRHIQVKDICSKIDYGYTAKANSALGEPKFLRITDIQDGNVNWDETPGCEIDLETEKKKKLQSGDIVFARTGGTVGKSYLIVNPPRAVFASYLIRLQIRESVAPEYVYHFFQSNDYWQQIGLNLRGGVQPNVNATRLGNLTLSLPPLSEQKRIAAILNDHMADIARARAAAEAQLEAAEALSAAYLREIFGSDDAKKWPNLCLREICILVNGKAFKPSDWSTSGKPIIRIQNLNDATKPFNYWDGSLEKQVIVNPGAVLLAWSGTPGTSFGAHIWNREDGVLNQHIFRVDFTRPDILPEWFTYSVNQRLDVLIHQAHGGVGLRHVKKSQVEALEIPLPPLSEQKRITAILNDRMADIARACTAVKEKLETINQLPSAIFRKAFNGEL